MLEIGNIIKYDNEEFELINIDRYDSGRRRYHLKCLKCDHVRTTTEENILKSIKNKKKCGRCSKNVFRLSEDGTYWIGVTQKGEEFYFNGDNIKYIMKFTWRKTVHGYFQNRKGEKLHSVVMGITDRDVLVNHLGGNLNDNRIEYLSISDHLDNSKEKKVGKSNHSGIIGLLKRGKNDKYVGNVKINDVSIYSKYKPRDEALIDLLIMQRHYGFRHNIDLYYLLDNVSEERIEEVIDNCERQLNKKRTDKIVSSNKFVLSEDGKYYTVYCEKGDSFLISKESKELVEKGIWHTATCDSIINKTYVHGMIVIDGSRKTVKLHRYILGLLEQKYKHYPVYHINGNPLDNRLENLIITTAEGNGVKSCGINIKEIHNKNFIAYRVIKIIYGKKYDKTFRTIEEAKEYVKYLENLIDTNRPKYKNKEELDVFLNNKNY